MGVYEILTNAVDLRKGGNDCSFNGFLEDYLTVIAESDSNYGLFSDLLEIDSDAKICVDYAANISNTSVSNTIIRYKDINNLEGKPLHVPFIIYSNKNNRERALLLADEYVVSKGYYYSVTESGAEFEDCKNDILAIGLNDRELAKNAFSKIFDTKVGYLQRDIDRDIFENYDQMYEQAKKLSDANSADIFERLNAAEDKEALIRKTVCTWFVLKKYVYVQYMVDKRILNDIHEGNPKAQRNQAKINADSIRYISIPELRRGELFKRQA